MDGSCGFWQTLPPPHLCIFVCEMYNREAVIVSGGGEAVGFCFPTTPPLGLLSAPWPCLPSPFGSLLCL